MKFNTYNTLHSTAERHPLATTNAEGGLTYTMSPHMELYTRVATALMGEDTFYQGKEDKDAALLDVVQKVLAIDPLFVLQLARYTRHKLYLRSVTTALLAEYANSDAVGLPFSRQMVADCILRPDDMTELVAYQLARNRRTPRTSKLPQAIKNGIRLAFPKFDAYRLAKYNRDGEVKLRDVLFLTHPKARDSAQLETWEKLVGEIPVCPECGERVHDGICSVHGKIEPTIITKTLEPPATWEVMRSTGKMSWSEVINQVFHKDGRTNNYMAIIRNLRNCIQSPTVTSADRKLLATMIRDENAIKHAKILPFRLFSAYVELRELDLRGTDISDILIALDAAATKSIQNLPRLPGTTVIAIDTSGSMAWSTISAKSKVQYSQISVLLGMMARAICDNAIVCRFDTSIQWLTLPDQSILRNAYDVRCHGGATNGYLVLNDLIVNNISADRIVFLTDMVLYDSDGSTRKKNSVAELWLRYRQSNPKCKLYNVDLAGYGHTTVAENMGARVIGGWSDRVLEMITLLETPESNVLEEIRRVP